MRSWGCLSLLACTGPWLSHRVRQRSVRGGRQCEGHGHRWLQFYFSTFVLLLHNAQGAGMSKVRACDNCGALESREGVVLRRCGR